MPRKDVFIGEQFCQRLAGQSGRRFWRSLDELAETEEFQRALHREFPEHASEWMHGLSRRRFLAVMGASLALAGLSGCATQPEEKIVPYVRQPETLVPGRAMYFATVLDPADDVVGVLVESHEGRPTKIEGNPLHSNVPATMPEGEEANRHGASDAFAQAMILSLYDPDRSEAVTERGEISSWRILMQQLRGELERQRASGGAGLRVLTEPVRSPTLAAQIQGLLAGFPNARWHRFEPVHGDMTSAGARIAFGRRAQRLLHLERADVILSLGDDFLSTGPGRLKASHDFMQRRRTPVDGGAVTMNRLYAVESTPTITAAVADHHLALRPTEIEALAAEIARRLGVELDQAAFQSRQAAGAPEVWIAAVVDDLLNYRISGDEGTGLVLAGATQSPRVHLLAHLMNERLGAIGTAVSFAPPIDDNESTQTDSLAELVNELNAGSVELLVILGGNPAYTAPADYDFPAALAKAKRALHASMYVDETSELCHWHAPLAHPLESWGDLQAADGTVSVQQPLISPLYDGKTCSEVVSLLLGSAESGYELVRNHWQNIYTGDDFDQRWQEWLHNGVIADTAAEPIEVSTAGWQQRLSETQNAAEEAGGAETPWELLLRPDPTVYDGRYANNAWLQELPKPLTKLTWDNALLLGPEDAANSGLKNGDMVEIAAAGRAIEAAVWIVPGQAERCVTLSLGYGRSKGGRVGEGAGFNAFKMRTSQQPWRVTGVKLRPTGEKYTLASTQHHALIDGRDILRAGTLEELRAHPDQPEFVHPHHTVPDTTLLPKWEYNGYKWGMGVDIGVCTGCSACVVACQAENNIPVVGKEQVEMGREMHWLRVDRYYLADEDPGAPAFFQPVPCMHCEHAPCELVCPVAATVHGDDGLNQMVYNRCIGTRYCSNNCPYKVRRFNFLDYTGASEPVTHMLWNPDVTVRSRGVMEKCTYCVQRISQARIDAEREGRRIRDGEVVTACQGACPTRAIVFGDLNDPDSEVNRVKRSPLNYAMLEELNTFPRTTYLAAVRNPNPRLAAALSERNEGPP